jgi:hypothetical protein
LILFYSRNNLVYACLFACHCGFQKIVPFFFKLSKRNHKYRFLFSPVTRLATQCVHALLCMSSPRTALCTHLKYNCSATDKSQIVTSFFQNYFLCSRCLWYS